LRAAEATATEAERGAAKHERRLRDARTERDRLHRQVGDLERRLRDLRDAEDQAERDMLDASAARDAADLKVRGARDRVTRARTALDQLTAPGA
jgi:chromosome segregation ATPase